MDPMSEGTTGIERPKEVTRGVEFLLAAFALGFITAALHLTQRISGSPLVVGLVIVSAYFGLCLLLVWRAAAGRNWARIVLVLIVLLGVPFAVPTYMEEIKRNVLAGSFSIFLVMLQLIGTYLLFTRKSNIWFRGRK